MNVMLLKPVPFLRQDIGPRTNAPHERIKMADLAIDVFFGPLFHHSILFDRAVRYCRDQL